VCQIWHLTWCNDLLTVPEQDGVIRQVWRSFEDHLGWTGASLDGLGSKGGGLRHRSDELSGELDGSTGVGEGDEYPLAKDESATGGPVEIPLVHDAVGVGD